jgi:hypothetical protein
LPRGSTRTQPSAQPCRLAADTIVGRNPHNAPRSSAAPLHRRWQKRSKRDRNDSNGTLRKPLPKGAGGKDKRFHIAKTLRLWVPVRKCPLQASEILTIERWLMFPSISQQLICCKTLSCFHVLLCQGPRILSHVKHKGQDVQTSEHLHPPTQSDTTRLMRVSAHDAARLLAIVLLQRYL